MFGIFSWLGEISVSTLEKRVLVAVAQLLRQREVAVAMMFFGLGRTLGAVRVVIRDLIHG